MNLDDGIRLLGKRFLGMSKETIQLDPNLNNILTRIEVNFGSNVQKHQWNVFGHPINVNQEKQIIRVIKKRSDDAVFYLVSLDDKIDFIDLISHAITIVDVNSEMEKKMTLMQEKINELGILFNELTYSELKTLKFNYKKSKKKKNIVEENEVIQECETINPPQVETVDKIDMGRFEPHKNIKEERYKIDKTPESVIPENI
jgi:hypothetical protein